MKRRQFPDDIGELLFVWGAWAMLSFGVLGFVWSFGSRIPFHDGWHLVRDIAAGQELSASWLWAQEDVNRFPFSRLGMWLSFRLSEGDLRWGMVIQILPLIVISAILLTGIRSIRGRSSYCDAVIPMGLLHLGHADNFLWFHQIHAGGFTALSCFCVYWLNTVSHKQSRGYLWLGVLALILLPLHASFGLSVLPPFVAGYALVARSMWLRTDRSRRRSASLLLAGCSVATLVAVVYVLGLERSRVQSESFQIQGVLWASLEASAMSLGPIATRLWPLSGLVIVFLGLLVIFGLTLAWLRAEDRQSRISVLLAIASMLGTVMLCLAVGVGRTHQGGLLARYSIVMFPLIVSFYVVAVIILKGSFSKFIQFFLFSAIAMGLMYHFSLGLRTGKTRKKAELRLTTDIDSGVPMMGIVARHGRFWSGSIVRFRRDVSVLRASGVEPFSRIYADPEMSERSISVDSGQPFNMERKEGYWDVDGRDSRIEFVLPEKAFVYAVQIDFVFRGTGGSTEFELQLRSPDGIAVPLGRVEIQSKIDFNTAKRRRTETMHFWVNRKIDAFSISPTARSGEFEISKMSLLTRPIVAQ
jgi:hypothetical protein